MGRQDWPRLLHNKRRRQDRNGPVRRIFACLQSCCHDLWAELCRLCSDWLETLRGPIHSQLWELLSACFEALELLLA